MHHCIRTVSVFVHAARREHVGVNVGAVGVSGPGGGVKGQAWQL